MNPAVRIVIVDDDVNMLFLLEQTLKKAFTKGEYYTFQDSALALAYIVNHPIDLLITDNQMPQMQGWELARELRAQGSGLPILMISGSPDAELKGIAAGVTRFIDKASESLTAELILSVAELLSLEPAPEAASLYSPRQSEGRDPKRA